MWRRARIQAAAILATFGLLLVAALLLTASRRGKEGRPERGAPMSARAETRGATASEGGGGLGEAARDGST
ncbi:MAG: hypothetical protein ACREIU_08505, partial [Planctomycetota bacterium]